VLGGELEEDQDGAVQGQEPVEEEEEQEGAVLAQVQVEVEQAAEVSFWSRDLRAFRCDVVDGWRQVQ